MNSFDLIVVGGGPGGYSIAIEGAKKGLKVALFERGKVGGTCLNVGCIPTKYLVDKAAYLVKTRSLSKDGIIDTSGRFSFANIQKQKDKAVGTLVSGTEFLLKKNGVEVVSGEAKLVSAHVITCNGAEYSSEKATVIATGSVPVMPKFPGSELAIDSSQVLALESLPRSMTIIGGGVIGLELASIFASMGTSVSIIEMLPALLPNAQPEAAKLVVKGLADLGVDIVTNARVVSCERDGLITTRYEVGGSEKSLASELVVAAVGRRPNLSGIDAKSLGIELGPKGNILVDANQRTSLEGVWAIGDVACVPQLAHAAFAEGQVALSDILGSPKPMDMSLIPSCVFTNPPYASVGMTMAQAKDAGFEPALGWFAYGSNGMAIAEGAQGRAFVVMDTKSGKTLGMSIVGDQAAELIALGEVAVSKHLTIDEWESLTIAHPSLSETVREAALDAFGRAVHKI
ncbi:MAG: dihydrolipoyl dehydrogenase [Atopobiaceae bacterium]|jgi:dihydrolipoamide dehydrogenase|nr:dihydrolipoyl dehydrogenase [Atopobiaceae bacterium]MCH4119971.1 dihydrolipoyl dehydrogenase [Atopobiaceae bacterium]MCI1389331.1 dihydrolipoyl dehydrogenase [Atopobiaceae bacterium]MCI1432394.1 dihydrolipoyl dehydrogenase [Atopobiaceae bacterium]MCI1470852.1 dihydrolipoyl dehydrogenase [Atopobiaceae bacterium]